MKTSSSGRTPRNSRSEGAATPGRRAFRLQQKGMRTGGLARMFVLGILLAGLCSGCAYYGFSGASIPAHLDTIAIPLAENNTTSPIPTLGRDLTSRLTDRFIGRTRYSLNNNEADADAVLTTRIREYTNRPSGVGADERATSNTVSIRVQVRYYDQVRDSTLLDRTFEGTRDYTPGTEEERQAAEDALEDVSDDIFTTATSNW